MRLTKRGTTALPDLNMTPMIDVVFQLLIFFMLVPHMSQVNKELLELPKLEGGTEDQEADCSDDQRRSTRGCSHRRASPEHRRGRRSRFAQDGWSRRRYEPANAPRAGLIDAGIAAW